MFRGNLILVIFVLFANSAQAQLDLAVSVVGDYAASAMTELASSPSLLLLKNEDGKKRHAILGGYLKMSADDTVTLSTGGTATEVGEATGFGISYGFSKSFKDRWAYFLLAQLATYNGEQAQTTGSVITTTAKEMNGNIISLSGGISYEFLRESELHTLNVFGGPSLQFLDSRTDIATFNSTTGLVENNLAVEISALIPAVTLGLMYEARWFEKWRIAFYGLVSRTLTECVEYDAVEVNVVTATEFNSPECGSSSSLDGAQIDIASSFFSLGFKVQYVPWKLGINISSVVRNAIFKEDEAGRAEVTGVLFSLSKSWGDD